MLFYHWIFRRFTNKILTLNKSEKKQTFKKTFFDEFFSRYFFLRKTFSPDHDLRLRVETSREQ